MKIVVRKLIAKEIYVNRRFIIGASVAGVLSTLIAGYGGKAGFSIGSLTWLTSTIAFGVMLAIYGVANERKEQALLFVLSLPLSISDYVRAKQIGQVLSFGIPWLVSSLAALILVRFHPDVPDGLLPYTLLLCVFMLANFLVLLCAALHATSEALTTTAIIITNMGVSVFMFTVGAMPAIRNDMFGPVAVWNDTIWTVLAVETLVIVISLILPSLFAARRRDFI